MMLLRPAVSSGRAVARSLARQYKPHRRLYSRVSEERTISASALQFGQPVHETHPHVLSPGELTPGITAQEYYDRRTTLAALLPPNSAAVLTAAELKYRSGAVFYPFRQDSNFLYLTGFCESDSLAVIRKTGPRPEDHVFALFVRPKDPKAEQWNGPWSGLDAARDVFNADEVYDIHQMQQTTSNGLRTLLKGASQVCTDIESRGKASTGLGGLLGGLKTTPLAPLVHQLRAIKSPAEIANMRKAGQISGRVITDAMRQRWTREKDLAAFLDYNFTSQGCDGPAYVPVVAGGSRGAMIHYVLNNAALDPDVEGTVLVDAGGEYGTYVTDITRTWPLDGHFGPALHDLYEAVLRVQRTSVALCRANAGLSLDRIHTVTEQGLRKELAGLGFDADAPGVMSTLFPHHVGHYVGLDVHDVPGYSRSITLQTGHCVTIEPGVYVRDDERFPKHFRGMAVRIEDSVCVQPEDPLILTTEAVKEVDDIEALRQD